MSWEGARERQLVVVTVPSLKPDYGEMNNTLLEMLLNATTRNLLAGSAAPVPQKVHVVMESLLLILQYALVLLGFTLSRYL